MKRLSKIIKYSLWAFFILALIYCYVHSCTNFFGLGTPQINKIERQDDGSYILADTTRFCNPNQKTFFCAHAKDSVGSIDHKTPCVHCGSRWNYHKTSLEWTEATMPSPL